MENLNQNLIASNPANHDEPDFDPTGTFVETAFTTKEIASTIEAEIRQGIRNARCAFLGNMPEEGGYDRFHGVRLAQANTL